MDGSLDIGLLLQGGSLRSTIYALIDYIAENEATVDCDDLAAATSLQDILEGIKARRRPQPLVDVENSDSSRGTVLETNDLISQGSSGGTPNNALDEDLIDLSPCEPPQPPLPEILRKFYETQQQDAPRKLVTIRRIHQLTPRPKSPDMVVAHIDGWEVVVRAGTYHEGQMVLFAEVDSFLPLDEFKNMIDVSINLPVTVYNGVRGYHLKTLDFDGQLSQGLIFQVPMVAAVHDIAEVMLVHLGNWDVMLTEIVKFDFAALLGVQKWETGSGHSPQLENGKEKPAVTHILGKLPPFVRETSATRVQNCPNLFTKAKYWKNEYQETVKLDGESMSVYFVLNDSAPYRSCNSLPPDPGPCMELDRGRFGVCSHRRELNHTTPTPHWDVALHYHLPTKLASWGKNIVIQGELVGAAINGNRQDFARGSHDFFVFDVFDIDNNRYCTPRHTAEIATELGLKHVPIRGYAPIREIAKCHGDLLERARQSTSEGPRLQVPGWPPVQSRQQRLAAQAR